LVEDVLTLDSRDDDPENSIGQRSVYSAGVSISRKEESSSNIVGTERSLVNVEVVRSSRGLRVNDQLVTVKLGINVLSRVSRKIELNNVLVT